MLFICQPSYAEQSVVVVLHGIARSSSHMEPLVEVLTHNGYKVVNVDYPSTDYTMSQLVDIIYDDIKTDISQAPKVHFIGYSMGGIMVRGVLHKYRMDNIGRVIQLAAPNGGSEVADAVHDNPVYQAIYGPAGQELTTTSSQHIKELVGDHCYYELGVIAGNSSIDPVSSLIIPGDDDGKVAVLRTHVEGMKDHIVVAASHTFFPSNQVVHQQVLHFLEFGKFDKAH